MPVNWNIFTVRDLSGGMNRSVSELVQPKDEVLLSINWDTSTIGQLTKSTGYSMRGTAITNNEEVLGGASFYYADTQQLLMGVDLTTNAADVYQYDPGADTWGAEGMSLTAGAKMEFATFLDGLFLVNYSDATRYYNGTTWSTSTNVTGAPKARFAIPYNDRLYLAELDVSGTAYSSRVAYSSLPDSSYNITWDMTDPGGQWFDVSPKDGDKIKGLGKNFSRLLIFKEESLYRYDTNTLYQFPGAVGTNSQRSIVNVLDYTFYFHKTGVYAIQYNNVVKVSRPIEDVIDGVSAANLDRICAYRDGDFYKVYLGDISNSITGLTISKCLAVLDVAKMTWSVESLDEEPRVFVKYRDDRSDVTYDSSVYEYDQADKTYDGIQTANDFVYFGDSVGDIYQLSEETYTHDGVAIVSELYTPNYYFAGGPHREGILQQAKVYIKDSRRVKLFYSVDDGPWRPAFKKKEKTGQTTYEFEQGLEANRVKFKIIDNSIGKPVYIKGWDLFFTPQTEIS